MAVLLVAVAALAVPASASFGAETANVAPCEDAAIGSGPGDWRESSFAVGPVGILRAGFHRMDRTASGMVAKMPLMVAGSGEVTISVPPALRGRVFLYFGRMKNRDGEPTTSFAGTRGYDETRFEPCSGRPRTWWPGGLRVRGTAPVRLLVRVEGSEEPLTLRLGRPRAYAP